MVKRLLTILLVLSLSAAALAGGDAESPLFPPIEPYESGMLKVSDIHEIYYELSGNPKGKPVFVLHGGPGAGCSPRMRRYFNPEKYLIVLHDQRGCGQSKPYGELRENNTQALVSDIEVLRKKLGLDKIIVFGGSWGSTLGLAYAEAHPEHVSALVLRGLWLCTNAELEYWYGGGTADHFPEEYERLMSVLPKGESGTLPERLMKLLTSDDEAVRRKAAKAWAWYEIKLCYLEKTDEELERIFQEWDPYAFSLLENYYMVNNCFLRENQLAEEAGKLKDIPITVVNGRYDVICLPRVAYEFCRPLPNAKLIIAERAGHSQSEPPVTKALVEVMQTLE